MFNVTVDEIEPDQILKYGLTEAGIPISYIQVIERWQRNAAFRRYFATLLADAPFPAYRWETPPIDQRCMNRPFEFVLLSSPQFRYRQPDAATYHQYFNTDGASQSVVTFANLGGDAVLVVPSPRTHHDAYGHLAAFVRSAPSDQIEAFWKIVAKTVKDHISDRPLWLSTAGGGVAWLHVRLDAHPKYYGYAPYRKVIGEHQ